MSVIRLFVVAFLALMVPAAIPAASAQSQSEAAPEQPGEAAYMQPLGRLAMILGSMHFLRKLCGDPQAEIWRQKMQELIAAQEPAEAEKKQLIASFNNGYRTFAATYRSCTSAARIAVNRYRQEGAALAREIGSRYGS
ncbi:TIGR02301 family protein [Jiella pacifica]|uniref:TIGR02301 family protein n=1 Tax=Jiella pacifica TaxID=2696469 RepID=A0A6N9TAB9_9HYPH|nr:TIGR02301 family protein [Jiella pacifica]NDW06649.1 TIGR02301 family protein [Jiella pacifica]